MTHKILNTSEEGAIKFPSEIIDFYRTSLKGLVCESRTIGEGSFGKVHRVRSRDDTYFAIKSRSRVEYEDEDAASAGLSEEDDSEERMHLRLTLGVTSPHLTACSGFWKDGLVMPLFKRNLAEALEEMEVEDKLENGSASTSETDEVRARFLKYMIGAARGLEAIHSKGVAHGDFKHANVFIKDELVALGDFGNAYPFDATTFKQGALLNQAPEILMLGESDRSTIVELEGKPDVWAYGNSLLMALTGELGILQDPDKPFMTFPHAMAYTSTKSFREAESIEKKESFLQERLTKIFEKYRDRVQFLDPSGSMQKVIRECLKFDASTRPSMEEIVKQLESESARPKACESA